MAAAYFDTTPGFDDILESRIDSMVLVRQWIGSGGDIEFAQASTGFGGAVDEWRTFLDGIG